MDTNTQTNPLAPAEEKFRGAADAAEQLIEDSAQEAARVAEQFQAAASAAGELAQTTFQIVGEQITAGAKATDRVIRKNPYAAVGVALGAGVLIGYLIKRK
jgi:ElaB/YqjD/DUF883 family membrane-anchored ribosome-binding protein